MDVKPVTLSADCSRDVLGLNILPDAILITSLIDTTSKGLQITEFALSCLPLEAIVIFVIAKVKSHGLSRKILPVELLLRALPSASSPALKRKVVLVQFSVSLDTRGVGNNASVHGSLVIISIIFVLVLRFYGLRLIRQC